MNKYFSLLYFSLLFIKGYSQEVIKPTIYNSSLYHFQIETTNFKTGSQAFDTLSLPFIDDFSQNTIYPNHLLWIDQQAYVNTNFAINPPSIGVVTLDGLNEQGLPYGTGTAIADHLTSQCIDLSNDSAGNNVGISFYYQAGGNGDAPEDDDSLILEFKNDSLEWETVWGVRGGIVPEFNHVFLKLDSSRYFHKGFQFRFKSYALISGNNDHWNLDFIKLDRNRTGNDTLTEDISWGAFSNNILSNYFNMPWDQFVNFEAQEMKDSFDIQLNNTYTSINTDIDYSYQFSYLGGPIYSSNFVEAPMGAGSFTSFPQTLTPLQTELSSLTESIVALTSTYFLIDTLPQSYQDNDTITLIQPFDNYLSYDDGSAEKAYGIEGAGLFEKKVAYQFRLNKPDTLSAIQIHFTNINQNTSNILFNIIVWQELEAINGGTEDIEIYRQDLERPKFDTVINGFSEYVFSPDNYLVLDGIFYIGWGQTDSKSLDVGFDVNENAKEKLFINVDDSWNNSSAEGALMIHPVFGKPSPLLNVSNHNINEFTITPSIVTSQFTINSTLNDWSFQILNIEGMTVKSGSRQSKMDISDLTSGFYFVQILDNARNHLGTKRLFKTNTF